MNVNRRSSPETECRGEVRTCDFWPLICRKALDLPSRREEEEPQSAEAGEEGGGGFRNGRGALGLFGLNALIHRGWGVLFGGQGSQSGPEKGADTENCETHGEGTRCGAYAGLFWYQFGPLRRSKNALSFSNLLEIKILGEVKLKNSRVGGSARLAGAGLAGCIFEIWR